MAPQGGRAEGDCRSELWFAYHLGRRIREKLAGSTDARDRPILELAWDYPLQGPHDEPDADAVLQEIGGRARRRLLHRALPDLADDGSTRCGSWLHAGIYADGINQTARKRPHTEQSWIAPEWGWAWPSNRRILYNRASADPDGKPWSERKRYVWWDAGRGPLDRTRRRPGLRGRRSRPTMSPPRAATGSDALRGTTPFIAHPDGLGWLYSPTGLVDGPLPTHYEPHESPFDNPLYARRSSPTRQRFDRPENPYNPACPTSFPFVLTTSG